MPESPHAQGQTADAPPSPEHFIQTLMSFQKTAALKAAVEIGVFGAIAAGNSSAGDIARATQTDARGAAILADYLVVLGFLTKSDDSYRLTPSSALFLDPASPANFGGVVEFFASPEIMDLVLSDPAAYVRNGGSVGLANVAPDNPVWVKFAEAMLPLSIPAAEEVAARVAALPDPPRKVLDISAGHGFFGIKVATALPEARVAGLDWKIVLDVAVRNAARAGVGDRYTAIPGSAFDADWGSGYDLVMIPGFLHHFDESGGARLLDRARASLSPGGRVLATEFVVDEDRLSPPWPAAFSFLMLATTQTGHAYSTEQLCSMARKAGFSAARVEPITPPHSLVWFE